MVRSSHHVGVVPMITYYFQLEAFDIDSVFGLTRASLNDKFKAPKILSIGQIRSLLLFFLRSQLGVGEAFLLIRADSVISSVELMWHILASHFQLRYEYPTGQAGFLILFFK